MELTMLGRALPRLRTNIAFFQPPFYVLIPCYLSVCLAMVTAGLLTMARREPPPNLFADYADLMPGNPRSTVAARGIPCSRTSVFSDETCSHIPASGLFSQVYVVIVNDYIHETRFTVRPGALAMGDLALWWGRPGIQYTGRFVELSWPARGIIALAILLPSHRLNYALPVVHVSFSGGERQ